MMKAILRAFAAVHGFMALLFALAAVMLMVIATRTGLIAFIEGLDRSAAEEIIQAVGLLAAAVVALQISQTIIEEEVLREAHISAPTRLRRFLSRFMTVIVVALAVEGLVATFKAQEDSSKLLYAAALLVAVGILLAGWGVFIRLNVFAEELEPEAMEDAKREDNKMA